MERSNILRRDRSQAVVVKEGKILLVQENVDGRTFFCLPGGGIEKGETPEEAALRELKEECNISGEIVRKLSVQYKPDNMGEVHTFLVKADKGQQPSKGMDPELEVQVISGVEWKRLDEISERDRMYLWSSGLLRVNEFRREAISWNDEISYPGKRK